MKKIIFLIIISFTSTSCGVEKSPGEPLYEKIKKERNLRSSGPESSRISLQEVKKLEISPNHSRWTYIIKVDRKEFLVVETGQGVSLTPLY
jgi:hypothetical protein